MTWMEEMRAAVQQKTKTWRRAKKWAQDRKKAGKQFLNISSSKYQADSPMSKVFIVR